MDKSKAVEVLERIKDRAGEFCNTAFAESIAALDLAIAALRDEGAAEPVRYEFRRARDNGGWTPWVDCTKENYDEVRGGHWDNPDNNRRFEARALYTCPAPAKDEGAEASKAPYGYCPVCGSPGALRERRLNGDDICKEGHRYPSQNAVAPTSYHPAPAGNVRVTGYSDRDRARIVSALQSARDRMARELPKKYGEGFDGDLDTMLDAINYMKRAAQPAVPEDEDE